MRTMFAPNPISHPPLFDATPFALGTVPIRAVSEGVCVTLGIAHFSDRGNIFGMAVGLVLLFGGGMLYMASTVIARLCRRQSEH